MSQADKAMHAQKRSRQTVSKLENELSQKMEIGVAVCSDQREQVPPATVDGFTANRE
jgi:hypothetical protein